MGNNKTSQSSAPITAEEQLKKANIGNKYISDNRNSPMFDGTGYEASPYQSLSDGDYSALEASIRDSRTAPLDRQKSLDSKNLDQGLSDRGVWSSGLAVSAQNDLNERYAPQYAAAGADAATQRYGLQANELQGKNTYNATQDKAKTDAKWRPLDYLQGNWTGNGGTVSSSSGGGWSI